MNMPGFTAEMSVCLAGKTAYSSPLSEGSSNDRCLRCVG